MSQEWKKLFSANFTDYKLMHEKAEREKVEQETKLKRAEEDYKNFVRETLDGIHAKEILTFIQETAFNGKGKITEVFTTRTIWTSSRELVEKKIQEPVYEFASAYDQEYETVYRKEWEYKSSNEDTYMSGIALDLPISLPQLQNNAFDSIFIGYIGKKDLSQYSFWRVGIGYGLWNNPDTLLSGNDIRKQQAQVVYKPRYPFIPQANPIYKPEAIINGTEIDLTKVNPSWLPSLLKSPDFQKQVQDTIQSQVFPIITTQFFENGIPKRTYK